MIGTDADVPLLNTSAFVKAMCALAPQTRLIYELPANLS